MALSDITCQTLRKRASDSGVLRKGQRCEASLHGKDTSWNFDIDFCRTAEFAVVGLTLHGPLYLYGYRFLEFLSKGFQSKVTLGSSILKAGASNLTVFPAYLSLFYAYLGALKGLNFQEIRHSVRDSFPSSFGTGFAFWALADTLNFRFVPAAYRVYYAAVCGLVWNIYLSSKQEAGKETASQFFEDAYFAESVNYPLHLCHETMQLGDLEDASKSTS